MAYRKLTYKQMKGVDNAWLAPNGKMYRCGYMGHNEWAFDYIKDVMCRGDHSRAMKKKDKICGYSLSAYPYCALHKLGWFRILTWSSNKTKLLSESDTDLTHEQKDTLMFWCSANGLDYDKFLLTLND